MPKKSKENKKEMNSNFKGCKNICTKCGSGMYTLGFLGSAIYYISTAGGFWVGVLGILKSLVWPAFLVFELLKFLGA